MTAPIRTTKPLEFKVLDPPKGDRAQQIASLRDALARLYDSPVSARIVAIDAGLDVLRLHLMGTAQEIWQAIIEEADKQRRLGNLVRRALEVYREDHRLLAAAQALGLA